jgi:hypothetical protein
MYQRSNNITYFEKMSVSLITLGVLIFVLGFFVVTIF